MVTTEKLYDTSTTPSFDIFRTCLYNIRRYVATNNNFSQHHHELHSTLWQTMQRIMRDLSMENNSSDVRNLIRDNIAINIATTHSYKLTLSPDQNGHAPFSKKRTVDKTTSPIKIRYSRAASGSNMESAWKMRLRSMLVGHGRPCFCCYGIEGKGAYAAASEWASLFFVRKKVSCQNSTWPSLHRG